MIASIVITTKDRAKLLEERSLKSALNQTFKDYEVIVVDDAGTDNTEEVMKKYNVQYYKLPVNKGLSYARNYGIKKANGKYVCTLDDDNELMPEFLDLTTWAIKDSSHAAVVVGRKIKYKNFEDFAMPPAHGPFTAIDWGWLIKREVFDHIQYDENLRANEDTDFGIQFWKKYDATFVYEPLTIAYDTENSLSFPTEREIKGMFDFLNKNEHEYEGYPDEKRVLYRTMGRKLYRGGYEIEGIKYFWKSFNAKPGLNSFLNLFFILFGWTVYNCFMTTTEYVHAKLKT